ncbi:alcohol dehydogenase [Trametes sanguinea]|nr:alcohol dehydogenase [Trametes sanguinea]
MAATNSTPSSDTMVAYRFVPGKTEPQRTIVPIPTPAADEVLIKVLAAGVCHSDVHILEASATQPLLPGTFIMGHEGAGVVVGHGTDVAADPADAQRLAIGTYVAVCLTNACGKRDCDACSRGFANVCFSEPMIGLGMDGCWAEFVKVRANSVVPVPGNNPKDLRMTPGVVAAATDAVMTPWHALKRAAGVGPGQTVVILGCGGLGINAIQIAKHVLRAGTVVASDLRAASLSIARNVGADYAVTPDELKSLLEEKDLRVDVVLDLVGQQPTVDVAADIVRVGGTVVLVGLGSPTVAISPFLSTQKQITTKGSFGGDYDDLKECLDAIAEGKIRPQVEERSMDECSEIIHGLAAGKIRSRVALVPKSETRGKLSLSARL